MATRPGGRYPLEITVDGKPRFLGCSKVQEYEWKGKLGEGTFGEVSKAESKKRPGEIVALKKILVHNEKDGFPITALREIKLLKALNHRNVLKLIEMAVERPKDVTKKSNMFMVTPYADHDLSGLLKNPRIQLTEPQIKCYMKQLLEGCKYLHESKILHRDMKAANLLISNTGILQIADFGLARPYDDPPPQPGKGGGEATRGYTGLVVTRWYRPPELLLGLRQYTTAVDMWGVGCVFGEMYKRKPILQGDSDLAQAQLIFNLVGSPNDQSMPGWEKLPGCEGIKEWEPRKGALRKSFREMHESGLDLLDQLMVLDWRVRINAIDALEHPYFTTAPLPARPEDLPIMEHSHEFDKQRQREERKAPPAPAGGQVGVGNQNEYGFQDRSRPTDQRGNRGGRYPHVNGANRRTQHRPPNGDYEYRGPGPGPRQPPRYDDGYEIAHRDRPRHYEEDQYVRRPPPQSYDDLHSRRPPPAEPGIPPRPPPMEADPYHNGVPPYRDDRGPPPRRIPPGEPPRVPPRAAADVDTYIPAYSSADPHARPPRVVLRDPTGPPRRPPMPGRDPDRYDDRGLSYDDHIRGPQSSGSYERRRSMSPRRDGRGPYREREAR